MTTLKCHPEGAQRPKDLLCGTRARALATRVGKQILRFAQDDWVVVLLISALFAPCSAANGQRGMMRYFGDPNEYYVPPAFHGNTKYDGRFTFARIKYRGYAHFTDEGPGWSHDYPRSDVHLMKIMRELTALRPFVQRGEIAGG